MLLRRALLVALTALAVAVAAAGCGRSYPSPFTAADMAKIGTGDALVHYLAQTNATATVCDRRSAGPHFQRGRRADFKRIVEGLTDDEVKPTLWQRCVMLMLESTPSEESEPLLEAMYGGYRKLVAEEAVEKDGPARQRLEAVHLALLNRPVGTAPREHAVAGELSWLRNAVKTSRLGPAATRYAREVLQSVDLEHGSLDGVELSEATLDQLQREGKEPLLRRIALRAPRPEIQSEAKRRIVRLHIASSPSAYVKTYAKEVEELVVATGHHRFDLAKIPPTSAWLDDKRARVKGVLVRQDVWHQRTTLLAFEGNDSAPSVLASVRLRGALYARVPGLEEPITLCAPAVDLDVTPCIAPSDVRPRVPVVFVDNEGLLHFVEHIAAADAQKLVYNTRHLPLAFEIAGREMLTVEWPVVFERPEDIVFAGPASGRGPDLRVRIERRYSERVLFEVSGAGRTVRGVVEPRDLDSFAIVSRGGAGAPGMRGADGTAGAAGSAGTSAMCPSSPGGTGGTGGRGGNGQNGGPGGPGGAGGDVVATVSCSTGDCARLRKLAERFVRSEGGAGGAGGAGGRGGQGGPGGPGGSGASCTDFQGHYRSVPGGTSGARGADGSPGMRGADGPRGAAGRVQVRIVDS